MKILKICFTGHRPKGLPWGYNENLSQCLKFKKYIRQLIIKKIKQGFNYFIVGMALGVDTIIAEILIDLKKDYNIFIECAIPCKNQGANWGEAQQKRYYSILDKSDKITYVSIEYSYDCMQKRNKYMVDNSDLLIAVWNGEPSGTLNTINYAKIKNIEIVVIDINNIEN